MAELRREARVCALCDKQVHCVQLLCPLSPLYLQLEGGERWGEREGGGRERQREQEKEREREREREGGKVGWREIVHAAMYQQASRNSPVIFPASMAFSCV